MISKIVLVYTIRFFKDSIENLILHANNFPLGGNIIPYNSLYFHDPLSKAETTIKLPVSWDFDFRKIPKVREIKPRRYGCLPSSCWEIFDHDKFKVAVLNPKHLTDIRMYFNEVEIFINDIFLPLHKKITAEMKVDIDYAELSKNLFNDFDYPLPKDYEMEYNENSFRYFEIGKGGSKTTKLIIGTFENVSVQSDNFNWFFHVLLKIKGLKK